MVCMTLCRYLKKAAKHRRVEEKVLALDDEERLSVVSSRLARGMERASSLRYATAAAAAQGRASRGGSVSGSLMAGSVVEAGADANQAATEFVHVRPLGAHVHVHVHRGQQQQQLCAFGAV